VTRKVSVLVVCTGNICRSPTGEGVLRQLAAKRGLGERVVVRSAGTHDYHVGECPDPRAVKHASRRGYDLSAQRAMQVRRDHFHEFDYILAMDRGHLRQLRAIAPQDARARLGMFLEASSRWKGEDVPDPYYGDAGGFEQVLDMVEEAAGRWLDIIEAELEPARFQPRSPR
jgi:protein-tyrosine phosphatase